MDIQFQSPDYLDIEGVDSTRWTRSLEELSVKEDFISFLDHLLPGWILFHTKEYAKELDRLRKNWENMCGIFHTSPREILIVQCMYHPKNPHQKMFKFVCDFLTEKGFIIRGKEHLQLCSQCSKAILTEAIQNELVKTGEFQSFTGQCSECNKPK